MTFVDVIALPGRIILFPFHELRKIIFYHGTYSKYMKLKEEVELLRHKAAVSDEVVQENSRLKGMLDLKQGGKYPMVAAYVIGRDPSNWGATLFIDKGERDGLKVGMPVVNSSSIIGKILEVGKNTSKVILLSDPSFSVASMLERSREQGLISGTLQGKCRMRYLSPDADIRVGDRVITSNLSSSFPEGLLIGEVTGIEESQSSPTMECLVAPAVSLSTVEEVLIIKK